MAPGEEVKKNITHRDRIRGACETNGNIHQNPQVPETRILAFFNLHGGVGSTQIASQIPRNLALNS